MNNENLCTAEDAETIEVLEDVKSGSPVAKFGVGRVRNDFYSGTLGSSDTQQSKGLYQEFIALIQRAPKD